MAHSTDTLDVRNLIMDWFVWRKCPLVEPRVQHVPFVAGWCRGCQSLVSSRLERSALLTSTVWLSPLAESEFCWMTTNNNLRKVLITRPILQRCPMVRCSNITSLSCCQWSLSAFTESGDNQLRQPFDLSVNLGCYIRHLSDSPSGPSCYHRNMHTSRLRLLDTMPAYCSHLHLSCST